MREISALAPSPPPAPPQIPRSHTAPPTVQSQHAHLHIRPNVLTVCASSGLISSTVSALVSPGPTSSPPWPAHGGKGLLQTSARDGHAWHKNPGSLGPTESKPAGGRGKPSDGTAAHPAWPPARQHLCATFKPARPSPDRQLGPLSTATPSERPAAPPHPSP